MDYSVSISARGKKVDESMENFLKSFPYPLENIDSVFGFAEHCRLYGGRLFTEPELSEEDIEYLYANKIGFRIPLQNHFCNEEDYEEARPFIEKYHRAGNSVIITNDSLARWIRRDYPLYHLEASVIKNTRTVQGLRKALQLYDTVVPLSRDFNDNIENIEQLTEEERNRIRLFLTMGCMHNCRNKICYVEMSKANRRDPDAKWACSQLEEKRTDIGVSYNWEMEPFLKLGIKKFKILRKRNEQLYSPVTKQVEKIWTHY